MSLLDRIKDAGIVGAGGAGFPTHAKLATKADYILLNGAECEPLLRVDQQLMALYPDEIIKGLEVAGRQIGASKALIGVKYKHKEVISILRERINALQMSAFVEVKEMADVYPAGDEQVLVYELTGRVVPEAGIPIHVGCVVINSETALNIYDASLGKPVIEKYITLAGDVPNRLTVKVLIGTPIMDVLRLSGIQAFDDYAVIDGGPMMGPVMTDLDGCISKKHKGFIILKKQHPLIRKKSVKMDAAMRINKSTCEQCRMCTDLCPRYLLGHNMQPHKIMRTVAYAMTSPDELKTAALCCQCNLCQLFSCPAGLYPMTANVFTKQKLAEQNVRYKSDQTEFQVRSSRDYRLLPSKRLVLRLGLKEFDKPAPLSELTVRPKTVTIAMSQHIGAPAIPVVIVGERVQAGQLIGRIPEGALGAAMHASISGEVVECQNGFIAIREG